MSDRAKLLHRCQRDLSHALARLNGRRAQLEHSQPETITGIVWQTQVERDLLHAAAHLGTALDVLRLLS